MLDHTLFPTPRSTAILGATTTVAHPNEGIELALFRAREVFEAGWRLTPDEAVALVGGSSESNDSGRGPWQGTVSEFEDEVSDIPLYFGER